MTKNGNPPTTPSATMHAERIRARTQPGNDAKEPAASSTAELYAARILPGYQADEELREEARKSELRARGTWVPGDDAEDYDEEDEEEAGAGAVDPLDNPERRSARAVWKSASTGGCISI
ncbi:hypothetical protein [Streptomyces sp. NPDC005283]|uniref:hypothetical protein n=1 Tax=Streptomyces sp. NPDC005283 TaxID=3156871 RepID=UPI0034566C6A